MALYFDLEKQINEKQMGKQLSLFNKVKHTNTLKREKFLPHKFKENVYDSSYKALNTIKKQWHQKQFSKCAFLWLLLLFSILFKTKIYPGKREGKQRKWYMGKMQRKPRPGFQESFPRELHRMHAIPSETDNVYEGPSTRALLRLQFI